MVMAISEGNSVITATSGGKTATCKVKVNKKIIPVASIEISKTTLELTEGDSETLSATVKPDDATDKSVNWSSSDPFVAVVNDGKVTAIKEGAAIITATSGEKSVACSVTVKRKVVPAESVELNVTFIELKSVETTTLEATILPENATEKTLLWTSSDETIVSVDDGVVTAHDFGRAIITVMTVNQFRSATCEVNVVISMEGVDLGLSVLWANMNLGAGSPVEYGDYYYYAWGETEPYYSTLSPLTWKNGKETGYGPVSYRWTNDWLDDDHYGKVTKYRPADRDIYWEGAGAPDNKLVLDEEDDAAHVNLGDNWRIPTIEEWAELLEKCSWKLMSYKSVWGYMVSSKVPGNPNSIFLPAANAMASTYILYSGTISGFYWTSALYQDIPGNAYQLGFTEYGLCIDYYLRPTGCAIRAVK